MLARKVTPGTAKVGSYWASSAAETDWPSGNPQLIDTTETPGWAAAVATAAIRSESDWLLASTSTICAPGAMAWAHSTSSASSSSQLVAPGPLGSVAGRPVGWPSWLSTVRNDEAGPYWAYRVGPESVDPNCESKSSTDWSRPGSS